jgi:thiol-disulfide isomerase/thioredoxin
MKLPVAESTPHGFVGLAILAQSVLLLWASPGFSQATAPGGASKTIPLTPIVPAKAQPGAAAEDSVPTLKAGAVAPNFDSTDLKGRKVQLSDWKNKVMVLDFWATWCGPCQQSLPHTQEVARQFKNQGVVVLAVCTSDTRAKFESWMNTNQAKYAHLSFTCDPNERGSATFGDRASRKLYGVSGIPTQFIVGRDGKIVAVLVGYEADDVRLEAALARAGIKVDPSVAAKGEAQFNKPE